MIIFNEYEVVKQLAVIRNPDTGPKRKCKALLSVLEECQNSLKISSIASKIIKECGEALALSCIHSTAPHPNLFDFIPHLEEDCVFDKLEEIITCARQVLHSMQRSALDDTGYIHPDHESAYSSKIRCFFIEHEISNLEIENEFKTSENKLIKILYESTHRLLKEDPRLYIADLLSEKEKLKNRSSDLDSQIKYAETELSRLSSSYAKITDLINEEELIIEQQQQDQAHKKAPKNERKGRSRRSATSLTKSMNTNSIKKLLIPSRHRSKSPEPRKRNTSKFSEASENLPFKEVGSGRASAPAGNWNVKPRKLSRRSKTTPNIGVIPPTPERTSEDSGRKEYRSSPPKKPPPPVPPRSGRQRSKTQV
jgi:hypothetical protein